MQSATSWLCATNMDPHQQNLLSSEPVVKHTEETSVQSMKQSIQRIHGRTMTHLSDYCFCTFSVVVAICDFSRRLNWNPHLIKFYRICLNFVPLTSQSKKCKVERNDGDIYGGTEIEMSNYPAILTHIGLSSCGQTVQHLLCCHCRALWDRISFIKPHKSEHVK